MVDTSGQVPVYRIADIQSPYGRLRDNIPLDGAVVLEMAGSIATVQSAFAPSILIGPSGTLTFTVDEGRGVSSPQTVTVTNSGVFGSLLAGVVTPGAAYVELNPSTLAALTQGNAATFTISVDSTDLVSGSSPYSTTVTVVDPTATNTPQTVPVQVVVRPKATISLSTVTVTFLVTKPLSGSFPVIADQTVTLTNTGPVGSVLSFLVQKLTGMSPWLTGVVPTTGTLDDGDSQVITLSVAPADSTLTGTYTETLRVSGYSTNNYVDITVTLVVS